MIELPDDILYAIFLCCVQDKNHINNISTTRISHSCQRWRSIALNAPMLWTTIQISRPASQYLDRHKIWVKRSQESYLNIVIIQRSFQLSDEFGDYLQKSLEILSPHEHRWRTLSVKINDIRIVISTLQKFQLLQMSELSSLALELPYGLSAQQLDELGTFNKEHPKLQEVDVPSQLIELMNSPKWSRILIFHPRLKSIALRGIHPIRPENCTALLRSCPLLEELVLDTPAYGPPPPDEPSSYYHPHPDMIVLVPNLKAVHFGPKSRQTISLAFLPLILRIQAPKLSSFHQRIPVRFISYFLSLPAFPYPSLTSVALTEERPNHSIILDPDDETMTFLSRLTSIAYIQLTDSAIRPTEWSGDNLRDMKLALTRLCPRLQVLDLHRCHYVSYDHDALSIVLP